MSIALVYRDRGHGIDGIRDYSRELNDALADNEADASLLLVRGKRLPSKLAQSDAVVLQYNPFAYGRWGYAPWLARGLRKLKRAPQRPIIAIMVHEPFMPFSGVRAGLMGMWQRLQLRSIRRASDVTFVSIEAWADKISHRRPKQPTYHVPVGSALPDMRHEGVATRAELGIDERTIVLTTFATGHPSHMSGHVCAAAIALREAGHPVAVLNLGAGARRLKGLPKAIRVETPGPLELTTLARMLAASDVFVSPFVDGVSCRRTTFMAGLQHALPVVATDGPLTDDLLRRHPEACRLIPVGDRKRFAATVVELAEDPARRERLAQGARLLFERHFAWPVIAGQIEAHLEEVFLAHLRSDTAR